MRLSLLSICAGWLVSASSACTIPVFRYALDRWPADKFPLEVSARDAKDERVAKFLRNFTDSSPINLTPTRVPADGDSRLLFPHDEATWTGALGDALASLTDSPARTEIVRRILAGENGVWVLVESGQREADDKAAATLEKRLRYLTQVAALPQIDPTDPTSRLGPGPALRVAFSLLRVKHDDATEQPFAKMLAGPKGAPAKPWFALVFGRGRVLGAWPAEGFGDEQIDEACLFLLGACSCQVKRMNPGWDLLLNVDWDEKLQAIGFPAATAEAPKKEPEPAVESVTIAPTTPMPAPTPSASFRNLAAPSSIIAVTFLVLGGAVSAWFLRRKP